MSFTIQQSNPSSIFPSPTSQQPGTNSYASIEIRDAVIKFSLYIQKLSALQQQMPTEQLKCYKLVRLSFQTFLKYSQNQQFAKQSFQMCKSAVLTKKSYYSLYIIDLMIKNSKYLIRQGRKQVESLFKPVWQRVYMEKENAQKLENLTVMVRCWGYLFGEKLQEHIRKWLESKYGMKRIQLTEQNERAIRQSYSDKKGDSGKLSNTSSNNNIGQNTQNNKISRETLINSLGEESNNNTYNILNKDSTTSILQRSISKTSQSMLAENFGEGVREKSVGAMGNGKSQITKQTASSSVIKKPTGNKLLGVNKSLLQQLGLQ